MKVFTQIKSVEKRNENRKPSVFVVINTQRDESVENRRRRRKYSHGGLANR